VRVAGCGLRGAGCGGQSSGIRMLDSGCLKRAELNVQVWGFRMSSLWFELGSSGLRDSRFLLFRFQGLRLYVLGRRVECVRCRG